MDIFDTLVYNNYNNTQCELVLECYTFRHKLHSED